MGKNFDYIDDNYNFESKWNWKKTVVLVVVLLFLGVLVWMTLGGSEAAAEIPQRQSINFTEAYEGKYMAGKICHIEKWSAQFVDEDTVFEKIKYWNDGTYELIDAETGAIAMVHKEDLIVLEGDVPGEDVVCLLIAPPVYIEDEGEDLINEPDNGPDVYGDEDQLTPRDDLYDGMWCPNCYKSKLVTYSAAYSGEYYVTKYICPSCDESYIKREAHEHNWYYTTRYDYVDDCTVLRTKICLTCELEAQDQLSATLISGPEYMTNDMVYHRVYYKMNVEGKEVTAATRQLHTWKHVTTDEYEVDECIYCHGWRNKKNK